MDFGFDFFGEEFGANLKPTTDAAKKAEDKAKKKAEEKAKKSTSSVKKKSKAKTIKVEKPVTVYGRNFTYTFEGSGEISLQEIAETLVKEGYDEIKHKDIRLFKVSQNKVLVLLSNYISASKDTSVMEFPVTFADGMVKATYEAREDVLDALDGEMDSEDDITLADMKKVYNEYRYQEVEYSYDITAGVIVPVMKDVTGNVTLRSGDTVIVNGEEHKLDSEKTKDELALDYLGEIPDGCEASLTKARDDVYFLSLKNTPANLKDLVDLDRSALGIVDASKTVKQTEEKISLPVTVYISNLDKKFEYNSDLFDGKNKITWDEMEEQLKKDVPFLRSEDRKIDHLYDKDENLVSATLFSGKKGAVVTW